ncbi:MAG: hypothetical protein JWO86_7630 [Myxococcaceae bacterium]|jgi:hypothetical protein|nr:hypothetical protein [Myxococcaceae bacterium]MEA2752024.1 hypothetical protein [Myxococcales bacterium]
MNSRIQSACVAIVLGAALFGALGCKRLGHAAKKDPCTLLTDAEIEAAMKLKVTSHKGDGDSCEWQLGSGAQSGIVGLMKSSAGAEAILNGTLGKGTPVAGVGDSASWLGGMTPILVVHAKGDIYRLSVTSPPLMTPDSASTKTTVVDRHKTTSGGTLETDAVSFDWPKLESGAVVLSKAFIARL